MTRVTYRVLDDTHGQQAIALHDAARPWIVVRYDVRHDYLARETLVRRFETRAQATRFRTRLAYRERLRTGGAA